MILEMEPKLASRSPSSDALKKLELHLDRVTRQYILDILRNKFEELFSKGFDKREKFNLYLKEYIDGQF